MLEIRVRLPAAQQTKMLRFLDPKRVAFAEREALNGTARDVQKTALKAISKEMGIERSKLAKRLRRPSPGSRQVGAVGVRRATTRKLVSATIGLGRPFNLKRFKPEVIRAGAVSSVKSRKTKRGGGRVIGITHEAWGRRQAAIGLFELWPGGPIVKRVNKDWKAKRGAIDSAYGPGVTHVMEYPHIATRLEKLALRVFPGRFKKRLRYAFSSASHLR